MSAEISKKNEAEAKDSLNTLLKSIDYEQIKADQEAKFQDTLSSNDYAKVIKVFNEKNIAKTIGHFFGLQDAAFCSIVVGLLQGEKRAEIIDAIAGYLPTEIPK